MHAYLNTSKQFSKSNANSALNFLPALGSSICKLHRCLIRSMVNSTEQHNFKSKDRWWHSYHSQAKHNSLILEYSSVYRYVWNITCMLKRTFVFISVFILLMIQIKIKNLKFQNNGHYLDWCKHILSHFFFKF